jgi:hypothetical protein
LLVIAAPLAAQEATPAPAPTSWHLLVEPAFMRPDYPFPIEGTKATVITPGLIRDGEVRYLTKADVERLKLDLASVRRVARAAASSELARLTPEYVRDGKSVILYARLTSDAPIVAGTLLAPEFAAKFADTLGPDLLVAIPNRYRAYVYPALASKPEDTAELVQRDYELSPYPVSREIFQVTPRGLKVVGLFGEQ